ncbi:hypothetical protein [Chryseobacterium arthrosphaerae]|uniref:Uncharacterized protein n=1 Tax=Chryseobacterium arthrosphaerae TaxID=651561 RepID=A0A1B8ZJA6_9FLAO|nr:hypothetical protein [Chryseobacterium arthrosphaerae]OCA71644.1 hypothetical protein BBI00_18260 [Chryseobacterium arthrosphaerae]
MKKTYTIVIISILIFFISLPFDAVYTKDHNVTGLFCFLLGWAEMQGGGIAWMANPLLVISAFLLLMKKPKVSAVISFLALALTFCFLSVGEITVDEAGHQYPITGYGPAYYLWITSCVSLFTGSIILVKSPEQSPVSR